MDFIVSRIAMSVCALLVIGILAGVVDIPQLDDTRAELEDFLEGFCRIAEEVAGARADVELEWTVSSLASGETVQMTIQSNMVSAIAAGSKAVAAPACGMHTWTWDGTTLNQTLVDALDASSEPIQAASGDVLMLRSMGVESDGLVRHMLFVTKSG